MSATHLKADPARFEQQEYDAPITGQAELKDVSPEPTQAETGVAMRLAQGVLQLTEPFSQGGQIDFRQVPGVSLPTRCEFNREVP